MSLFKKSLLKFKRLFPWLPSMRFYRPYILPTRHGLAFLVALFFLFLMALSYGHSMAFAATFLLTSLLMSSALLTHLNLKDSLVKSLRLPVLVREGEPFVVSLELQNTVPRNKKSLSLYKLGDYKFNQSEGVDLKGLEHKEAWFSLRPLPVGRYVYSEAQLMTSFPLGLFYSWMKFEHHGEFYIAPRAIDHMRAGPEVCYVRDSEPRQELGLGVKTSPEGDFYEHRNFEVLTDSWHHLDWKVYAKRDLLLKKSYARPERPLWLLDFSRLHSLGEQKAYEQLSYWLELCEQSDHPFHLVLKNIQLEGLQGREGVLNALKALSVEASKGAET